MVRNRKDKNTWTKYLTLIVLGILWLVIASIAWTTTRMNPAAALAVAAWPMTLTALVVGLMRPSKALPMVTAASRKRVAIIYGISTLVLQVGGEMLSPKNDAQTSAGMHGARVVTDSLESEDQAPQGITFKPSSPKPIAKKAVQPGTYYAVSEVKVRLAPHAEASVKETIDRGHQVKVFSTNRDWARVSRFYNGAVEGEDGQVANWVPVASLSLYKPTEVLQPTIEEQSTYKIQGIPKAGDHGLTARDVQILHAAARYYCETGKTTKVEYGDKSVTKEGMYLLNFGTNTSHFFRPEDIPDLEKRIEALGAKL